MSEKKLSILPLILAGGSGSRLWPLSRQLFPKQFLALDGGEDSLFQQTLKRTQAIKQAVKPLVIANNAHHFLVKEQAEQISCQNLTLMLEPFGKNTAIAVALGLAYAQKDSVEALLVLPSDHLMQDIEAFTRAIETAQKLTSQGYLTTFGIQPTRPETGYGYIQEGKRIDETKSGQNLGFEVACFVEKPDKKTAENYLAQKTYLWNSGLFMLPVTQAIEEFKAHAPDVWAVAETVMSALFVSGTCVSGVGGSGLSVSKEKMQEDTGLRVFEIEEEGYKHCPDISIDYAIMEKTKAAAVVPYHSDWSDLGAWQSVWQAAEKDEQDNVSYGDAHLSECKSCYVSSSSRLVALVGMENTLVVETADAVLVADLSDTQKVKALVKYLEEKNRDEVNAHRRVYRPWGWYETLCGGDRFQVKRIMVKAGQSLSLQKHHHRAEHWVIVKGTAEITRADEIIVLTEDQSSYIPLGTKHRLKNPGMIPLEIIEVQTGSYLGEDDIVRYEDTYGRKTELERS